MRYPEFPRDTCFNCGHEYPVLPGDNWYPMCLYCKKPALRIAALRALALAHTLNADADDTR